MRKRATNQQETISALRQLREAANLTQEELAFHLKKAASTIRRWEKGEEPSMTRSEWLNFCQVIGKSFYELPESLSLPLSEQKASQE